MFDLEDVLAKINGRGWFTVQFVILYNCLLEFYKRTFAVDFARNLKKRGHDLRGIIVVGKIADCFKLRELDRVILHQVHAVYLLAHRFG